MSQRKPDIKKLEIPENGFSYITSEPWPQVSFDIKLGKALNKSNKVIDFDTSAYIGSLANRGL